MPNRPSGTITFLFTDIEGSTRLWDGHRAEMGKSLAVHDAILTESIEAHNGRVFKTVGDAFCASFATPLGAFAAAIEAQLRLKAEKWEVPGGIRARMAIHTGTAEERDEDYFGPAVNRVARLLSLGHGGQTLLSLVSVELLRDELPPKSGLKQLGEFRLKDLIRPEKVFQLIHEGLPEEFPPLKSIDLKPHNLPVQPTPLIGREKDIAAIESFFTKGECRLLTLTGMGGIGKTRLAVQAGAELLEDPRFEHGVWFVELTECRDSRSAIEALARSLCLREKPGLAPFDVLKEHIRGKSLLIILDNLEQVLDFVPSLLELLADSPELKILATSREALRVRWECVYRVEPLGMPAREEPLPELGSLGQYEAVALFVAGSCAVRAGFAVTNANAPAVAEICWRLEGIPLAVELAAARSSMYGPEEILERLGDRLGFLSGRFADLPARQRTLRSAIEWSHELLSKDERKLFGILSVFSGSFDMQAVETVADEPEGRIASLLESLVDKSLAGCERADGGSRYRLLDIVREFGFEKLTASGDEESLRNSHAHYYLYLAECGRDLPEGRIGEAAFYKRMDADYRNYAAAIRFFEKAGDSGAALRFAVALARYWLTKAMLREGEERILSALTADEGLRKQDGRADAKNLESRIEALIALGALQRESGLLKEAETALEEAEILARESGAARPLCRALCGIGLINLRSRLPAKAKESFESALALAGKGSREEADAANGLGLLSVSEGRSDEARSLFERSLAILQGLGELASAARISVNLSRLLMEAGEDEAALEKIRETAEIFAEIGDKPALLAARNNLGYLHRRLGRQEDALREYRELEKLAGRTNHGRFRAFALSGIAECQLSLGRHEDALESAAAAEAFAAKLPPGIERGTALRVLAEAYAAAGNMGEALPTFTRAEGLLESLHAEEELKALREARGRYFPRKKKQAREPRTKNSRDET